MVNKLRLTSLLRAGCILGGVHPGRKDDRPMSPQLVEPQDGKAEHDKNPVDVVSNHGAVCGGIRPPQNRVEDSPASAAIQ